MKRARKKGRQEEDNDSCYETAGKTDQKRERGEDFKATLKRHQSSGKTAADAKTQPLGTRRKIKPATRRVLFCYFLSTDTIPLGS